MCNVRSAKREKRRASFDRVVVVEEFMPEYQIVSVSTRDTNRKSQRNKRGKFLYDCKYLLPKMFDDFILAFMIVFGVCRMTFGRICLYRNRISNPKLHMK